MDILIAFFKKSEKGALNWWCMGSVPWLGMHDCGGGRRRPAHCLLAFVTRWLVKRRPAIEAEAANRHQRAVASVLYWKICVCVHDDSMHDCSRRRPGLLTLGLVDRRPVIEPKAAPGLRRSVTNAHAWNHEIVRVSPRCRSKNHSWEVSSQYWRHHTRPGLDDYHTLGPILRFDGIRTWDILPSFLPPSSCLPKVRKMHHPRTGPNSPSCKLS